jgi:hypothetical protein
VELRKYNEDVIDADFEKSEVGQHLLQPSTMSNPKMAAASLKAFQAYRAATFANHEKQTVIMNELQVLSNGTAIKPWMTAQYNAAEAWFSATEDVYTYAANPANNIHLINGNLVVNDPDEYNKRVDTYNAASMKFKEANDAFRVAREKQRQSTGSRQRTSV